MPNSTEKSWAEFRIVEPLYANTLIPLIAAGVGIAVFVFLLGIGLGRAFVASIIINFIIISGVVVSILLAVLFTDVEWGANSPIGLIIKSPVDEKGQVRLNSLGEPVGNQWMLNVGGTPLNSYSEGVQIPVYVVVFGIIGGYLGIFMTH